MFTRPSKLTVPASPSNSAPLGENGAGARVYTCLMWEGMIQKVLITVRFRNYCNWKRDYDNYNLFFVIINLDYCMMIIDNV